MSRSLAVESTGWPWETGVHEQSLEPFPASLLGADAAAAARGLIGGLIVSTVGGARTAGVIVEAEAYTGPDDPASHAAERIGRTFRNRSMFGPAGTWYVYLSHGIHHCVNAVTGVEGHPAAVLIRALQPLVGVDVMRARRGRDTELCSGPGRLCQALGIDLDHDGTSALSPPLQLLRGWDVADGVVGRSGRIGISRAREWPLRFYVRGNPHVKSPRS